MQSIQFLKMAAYTKLLALRQGDHSDGAMLAEVPGLLADAQLAAALGAASDAGSEQSPERRQTRQSRRPPRWALAPVACEDPRAISC